MLTRGVLPTGRCGAQPCRRQSPSRHRATACRLAFLQGSDVDVQVPAGLPLGGGELASAGCYGSGTLNPSVNLDASAAAAAGPQLLPHGLPSPGAPGRSADSQGQQHSGGSIGACAAPPPLLPDLQQRALHQSCATPADATLLLCCARRAQQATPGHADHRCAAPLAAAAA